MAQGLTPDLFLAAAVVGFVGFWILARDLPVPAALLVAAAKLALVVAYFAWSDRRWTFYDDMSYFRQGSQLLAAGYSPFTILFHAEGLKTLFVTSGGVHILYGWWNHFAQYLFGSHYFAAVFLNVGSTFVAGAFLLRLCGLAGFGEQYARGLLIVFLLHWDVLAWSTVVNLKDVLMLVFTVAAVYWFARLSLPRMRRRDRLTAAAGLGTVLFLLLWIRFYAPVLLLATFALWVLIKRRGRRKYLLLGAIAGALLLVLPRLIPSGLIQLSPAAVVAGMAKMALTPQPWSIDPGYSFLLIPSLLHWIFFVPTVLGAVALWRQSPVGALVVLYAGVIIVFYGLIPELQGPRHRLQIAFALVWCIYHAAYAVLASIAPRTDGRAHTPTEVERERSVSGAWSALLQPATGAALK